MRSEADAKSLLDDLGSDDPAIRTTAADESTDGVSAWGAHEWTSSQAERIGSALVDALAAEDDERAREALLNALVEFATWDLVAVSDVRRALDLPRAEGDLLGEYWSDLKDTLDQDVN